MHFAPILRRNPFTVGVALGHWRLVSLSWPSCLISIAAALRTGAASEVTLNFDLTGYPAAAPTSTPWDLETGARWPSRSCLRVGEPVASSDEIDGTAARACMHLTTVSPSTATATGRRNSRTFAGSLTTTSPSTSGRSMRSFTTRTTPVFKRSEVLITLQRKTWRALLAALQQRGQGRRESGAFLVTSKPERAFVTDFVLYDDLDPDCLTGGIDFHGIGYHRLGEYCRDRGVRVVADVHTHPGEHTRQSPMDQQHPMVPRVGHIALVVPNFAEGRIRSQDVGVHRYRPDHAWEAWQGRDAARRLKVTWLW